MQEKPANGAGRLRAYPRFALLFALLSAATPAVAQTVQKCIASDGHVTLTSGTCGAGEKLVASYEAVPEPVSVEPRRPASSSGANGTGRATAPARAARHRSRTGAAPRARRTVDRCQQARDRRERTLRRVGLKRTFDLLRKLDDEVWDACGRL